MDDIKFKPVTPEELIEKPDIRIMQGIDDAIRASFNETKAEMSENVLVKHIIKRLFNKEPDEDNHSRDQVYKYTQWLASKVAEKHIKETFGRHWAIERKVNGSWKFLPLFNDKDH